jgi:hypothetical protein
MAAVEVGGDSSVKWSVDVDHVRHSKLKSVGKGPLGHQQEGVDETDPGEYFKICIELPKRADDRQEFLNSLAKASQEANGQKDCVEIVLRIEDDQRGGPNTDQIRIEWSSR